MLDVDSRIMQANATLAIVITVFRYYPAAQAMYLFGSLATGEAWPDSDTDIAVLLPPAYQKINVIVFSNF